MDKLIPKSLVPTGRIGRWEVKQFTVTKHQEQIQRLRALFNPQREDRTIPAGVYTALLHDGSPIMSDTPAELREFSGFVKRAAGNVLITGLGLGLVTAACLEKKAVKTVTVIEIDPDVIELVGTFYRKKYPSNRLAIIQSDAFKWSPTSNDHYTCAWHDIWPNICSNHLPEMARIKRRYAKFCDWQECWAQDQCRSHRERLKVGYLY